MTELTLIRGAIDAQAGRDVPLVAHRTTLAKRRWRGTADDGREFGFDLDEPLGHGAAFFAENGARYVIEQSPEEVIEIAAADVEAAARVAWNLGNLHFPVQVLPAAVRVVEDPAVLQFLERERVPFRRVICVYQPLAAGAGHSHGHGHGHTHGHHHD